MDDISFGLSDLMNVIQNGTPFSYFRFLSLWWAMQLNPVIKLYQMLPQPQPKQNMCTSILCEQWFRARESVTNERLCRELHSDGLAWHSQGWGKTTC